MAAALSEVPLPEQAGEFRLTSRRVLNAIFQYRETDYYLRGIVAHVGFKQKAIQFVRQERAGGESSANFLSLISYAITNLLSTTMLPIRMVTLVGFSISVIGLLWILWMIVAKFLYPEWAPHGFTTLASMIIFFSGTQIFLLGLSVSTFEEF